ncbi:MAG: hypothetical protein ACREYF_00310 [Gammaproteobacteria bacterium]
MTETLSHRGPDSIGYFNDGAIALGHTRLSIIDLEGGKQPISNETDSIFLICNGEIHNSPELRNALIGRGHTLPFGHIREITMTRTISENCQNLLAILRGPLE